MDMKKLLKTLDELDAILAKEKDREEFFAAMDEAGLTREELESIPAGAADIQAAAKGLLEALDRGEEGFADVVEFAKGASESVSRLESLLIKRAN